MIKNYGNVDYQHHNDDLYDDDDGLTDTLN